MNHQLMIQVTSACNMNCPYCYVNQRPCDEITVDDVRAQLPLAKKVSMLMDSNFSGGYAVAYFGGEPLLNYETIIALHDQVFSTGEVNVVHEHVQTNALLLTEEKLVALNERGVDVSYSFDGLWDPPESIAVHEQLLANGLLGADCAKIMIAPQHAGDLMENYAYFVDRLGWTSPDFTFVRDDVWSDEATEMVCAQMHMLIDDIVARTLSDKNGRVFRVGFVDLALKDMVVGKKIGKRDFSCFAGRNGMVLTHARQIYPCTRFYTNGECMLADANTGEVNDDEIKRLGELLNTHVMTECMSCELRPYCNAGCAYTQYVHGDRQRMRPVANYCKIIKTCFREAIRYANMLRDHTPFRRLVGDLTSPLF